MVAFEINLAVVTAVCCYMKGNSVGKVELLDYGLRRLFRFMLWLGVLESVVLKQGPGWIRGTWGMQIWRDS